MLSDFWSILKFALFPGFNIYVCYFSIRDCSQHCIQILAARVLLFLSHDSSTKSQLMEPNHVRLIISALDITHDPVSFLFLFSKARDASDSGLLLFICISGNLPTRPKTVFNFFSKKWVEAESSYTFVRTADNNHKNF